MKVVGVCAALVLTLSAAVPAQAVEAAVWAFVQTEQAVAAQGAAITANWAGSDRVTGVAVTKGSAGRYRVLVAGGAATNGLPMVTAVNDGAVHCQVTSFGIVGGDEWIDVACYRTGAALTDSRFALSFFVSNQPDSQPGVGAYGYVTSGGSKLYHSANGMVSVNQDSPRVWSVRFGAPFDDAGNVQVTAAGANAARCGVVDWVREGSGAKVRVRCDKLTTATGSPQWTLSYQRDRSIVGGTAGIWGYVHANMPSMDDYEPSGARNLGQDGHFHRISRADDGRYQVKVYGPLQAPVLVQLSATGDSSNYCTMTNVRVIPNPQPNQPTGLVDLICYNAAGSEADTPFSLTYYSPPGP